MTQKPHDDLLSDGSTPVGSSASARTTQPGLGSAVRPRAQTIRTFELYRPPLAGAGAARVVTPPPLPGSRGPEYHPPVAPAPSHPRGSRETRQSGTFRVAMPVAPVASAGASRAAPSVQVDPAAGAVPAAAPTPMPPPVARPVMPTPMPPPAAREFAAPTAPAGRRAVTTVRARGSRKALLAGLVVGLSVGGVTALSVMPVPVRAHAIVAARGAPQSITATVAGRVSAVLVQSGDEVGPGAPLVRIHSSELQFELDHRRRELLRLQEQVESDEAEDDATLSRSISVLWQRRELTRQRLELKDNEYARRQRLLDDVSSRVLTGSAPETEILEQQLSLQATREARLGIVDAKSELDGDMADRRSARQDRGRERQARLAEAEALLQAAESQLRVATVEAPGAGWIESLLVVPGSLVQPGTPLGRLVPRVAPRRVVALVALDEARHVQVGSEALVELSPAPTRKGRRLPALVHHVSREVAPHADVQQLLGEPTADRFVQIEIELLETPEYLAVSPLLRSGSTAVVELASPERTLGDVVLQTIENWLPAGWLPERGSA